MSTEFYDATVLKDAVSKDKRRSRHILAASGLMLESGEYRNLDAMYVMGRDSRLYKISELDQDPDKQTEDYTVKAQADHGEEVDGELVPTIEKQFGSCRVWLGDDGQLHAKMYFADNDALADHAFAISQDASYSIGVDWFADGYYGADNVIEEPIGILREISMVLTGNDPRAKTIDTKQAKAQGSAAGDNNNAKTGKVAQKAQADTGTNNGEYSMADKTKDNLTPDEGEAIKRNLGEKIAEAVDNVVNNFTTDVPEDKTEPTADDNKGEGEKTEDKKTNDAVKHNNIIVVRDRAIKQTRTTDSVAHYLKTDKAVAAFGQALIDAAGSHRSASKLFAKIAKTRDDVDFGEGVTFAPEAVVNAVSEQLNDPTSIYALVTKTGLKYEVVAVPTSEDAPRGHVRNQNKVEEQIKGETRVLTPEDLYKLMKLNHSMVEINGGIGSSAIVKYVTRELPRKVREAIDQGILVGGIKNDDEAQSDFTALISVLSDITAANTFAGSYGQTGATITRADISKAANRVTSGANRTLIMTADAFTDLENATTGTAGVPVFANGIDKNVPNINGISRIITPMWLTEEMLGGLSGIVVDLEAYHLVGNTEAELLTDYAIDTNKYVWEALALIGGGLASKSAAVGIAKAND